MQIPSEETESFSQILSFLNGKNRKEEGRLSLITPSAGPYFHRAGLPKDETEDTEIKRKNLLVLYIFLFLRLFTREQAPNNWGTVLLGWLR
jgi:hypothetical protein